MTFLALFINFFAGSARGIEDEGDGAILSMCLAGAVAARARFLFAIRQMSRLAVRIAGEIFDNVFVAGGAGGGMGIGRLAGL